MIPEMQEILTIERNNYFQIRNFTRIIIREIIIELFLG